MASKAKNTAKAKSAKKGGNAGKGAPKPSFKSEIALLVILAVCMILFISNFGIGGFLGEKISYLNFGLFGLVAYVFPVCFFVGAAFFVSNRDNGAAYVKIAAGVVFVAFLCLFLELLAENPQGYKIGESFLRSAEHKTGGGALGGILAALLCPAVGTVGAYVIDLIALIISLVLITERSFLGGVTRGSRKVYDTAKEDAAKRREAKGARREERAQRRMDKKAEGVALNTKITPARKTSLSNISELKAPAEPKPLEEKKAEEEKPLDDIVQEAIAEPIVVEKVHRKFNRRKEPKPVTEDELSSLEIPGFEEPGAGGGTLPDFAEGGADGGLFPASEAEDAMNEDIDQILNSILEYDDGSADAQASGGMGGNSSFGEEMEFLSKTSFDAAGSGGAEAFAGTETEGQIPSGDAFGTSDLGISDLGTSDLGTSDFGTSGLGISDLGTSDFGTAAPDAFSQETDAGMSQSVWDGSAPDAPWDEPDQIAGSAPAQAAPGSAMSQTAQGSAMGQTAPGSAMGQAAAGNAAPSPVRKPYQFPPVSLLEKGDSRQGDSRKLLQETALKLQQILKNFGVNVTITDVSCGPSVTRYELQPEMGVKVSKIVNLSDDIKLNLAATDIRIEAPIPGKAAVGIEVPNKEKVMVRFRDMIESEEFKSHKSNICFTAGKDIGGQAVVADIAKMPHLLIAGATGSGKSVCINTIIMSILYKANPEDVKLILIDPKVVELSVYNGIPHLLIPVVTDPKKAAGALHWAVSEMTDRYQKFSDYQVRDLKGYNQKVAAIADVEDDTKPQKMPQIVVIVDELADLMMVAPGDVEDAICRLAQLARAAGIHLIIATQRPSVDVITGLIKANMPSRIAFSVSSGVDSRTILDMIGAEKLLGNGDMLFYPQGYPKPLRVQGPFVSDSEVEAVVDFLKKQSSVVYNEEIAEKVNTALSGPSGQNAGGVDGRDAYFAEAGKFVIEKDKGSIGMLQRMFKIGFNRAARIMDQLEEAGVVGAEEGTKPRKILMTMTEFETYLGEHDSQA